MRLPYIGITDFTSFSQVEKMLAVFLANGPTPYLHDLHVGVMMSYKTLHGIDTKWSKAFPPKENIAEIFSSSQTMNCLHFADYDNMPGLDSSLTKALDYGGDGINALQLDMIWPDPLQVAKAVKASGKNVEVILQIGKNAFDAAGNDPGMIVDRLLPYQGIIQHVLLDKSMGKGIGMDSHSLIPFIEAIDAKYPGIGIGVAGGLGPDTLNLVEPIVKIYPFISIDAQGRLRPSGNALDPIDWNMAERYLARALQLFR